MVLLLRLPELYVALALVLTFSLALLTPPFFVPDEYAHSLRALQVGHGELLAHRSAEGVGDDADTSFARVSGVSERILYKASLNNGKPTELLTARDAELDAVRPQRWSGTSSFMSFPNTATYPATFYLPQAAGWALGKSMSMTIDQSLLLARLFAAWACIALGWCALRLCRFNRIFLFIYLLLPGVLSLTASSSQDGLLLTCAALIVAVLSRPLAGHRQFHPPELIAATLLIAGCAMARPPYLLFAPVLLLPALESTPVRRRALAFAGLGVLTVTVLLVLWQHATRPLGLVTAAEANPAQQVQFMRAHPGAAVSVILSETLRFSKAALSGGYLMGTNDVSEPFLLKLLSSAALLALLVLAQDYSLRFARSRAAALLCLLGIAVGLTVAEYVVWTAPGSRTVSGLQPRYDLPLLPFIFCLGIWLSARWSRANSAAWSLVALLLVLLPSLAIPWVAAHQMHGTGVLEALHHAFIA